MLPEKQSIRINWLISLMLVLVMSLVTSQPLYAQEDDITEMSLEALMDIEIETVVGASKYEQKVTEAPSSVTVITSDEIKFYGWRNLAEILNSVRSFYITYDRSSHYLGVRGFNLPGDNNMRTLVLIDGIRLNENIRDYAPIGNDLPIDVDIIDKIEIIRGPGSALYGSNAIFAVINIVTKKGSDYDGIEVEGQAGTFRENQIIKGNADPKSARFTFGKQFENGLDVLFSATTYHTPGQDLYFENFNERGFEPAPGEYLGPDGFTKNDFEDLHNFFGKISYENFTLTVSHKEREKGNPTAPLGFIFEDYRHNKIENESSFISLAYNENFSESLSMRGRVVFNRADRFVNYWIAHEVVEIDGQEKLQTSPQKDNRQGHWWDAEWQIISQPFDRHKITVGTEVRINTKQKQKLSRKEEFANPTLIILDDNRHQQNWGVYIQDEIEVADDTTFIAGLRHDHYDSFGSTTNPRLALVHNHSPQTMIKFMYGQAFRAPSINEIYFDDRTARFAADNLGPEEIETYEADITHYFNKNINANVTGFYYRIEDIIKQNSAIGEIDPLVYANSGSVEARGVELAMNGQWDNGIKFRTSYSYVDTENEGSGSRLLNSPFHLAKFNILIPVVKDKIIIGFENIYNSKRNTLRAETGTVTDAGAGDDDEGDDDDEIVVGESQKRSDDLFVSNLTISFLDVRPGMDIAAGIFNLFDVEHSVPAYGENEIAVIPQDGPFFWFRLTQKF